METFYKQETYKLAQHVPLEDMYVVSQLISTDVEDYRHSELQAAIAGVVISHDKPFTIVVSPTGSGKTWVQAIIAKYFCQ